MELKALVSLFGIFASGTLLAGTLTVNVNEALSDGQGQLLGDVVVSETPYGLLFTPNLKNLQPGIHGFHVHTNPS